MTPERRQQIEKLYYAAREVAAKERASFLERACDQDAELRSEVESLLAMHPEAGGFPSKPTVEELAKIMKDEPPSLLGRQLGAYKILSLLGAGGMGEVYKARDTRLNRTVAIKVLPRHLSERVELRQRFEREARAIAGLNHPNICALHDIGQAEGFDYLVMEYLEGETLSKRLKKGPLPTEQLMRTAIEIATALDQAHRRGLTHRDLKPGNIMLTKTGAKLLDFGLAKQQTLPRLAGATIPSLSPLPRGTLGGQTATESDSLTEEGMILGTLEYMAPEQVEGKEMDARTDIFAFGVVLYEMATGRKVFEGESKAGLVAAILTSQPPPITKIQPLTPPALEHVVKKCLEKDPEERWQSAGDLTSELKWIAEGGLLIGVPAPRRRERAAWATAMVATVALLILAVAYLRQPPVGTHPARLFLTPPERTTLNGSIAISPDGRQVAFAASTAEGSSALYVRPLDSLNARVLPDTEGALYPFWSPNSQFLGYFVRNRGLYKVRVEGGPPQLLAPVFDARGGSWSRDGVIVFSPNDRGPLQRISEGGGTAAPVTKLEPSRQESSHQRPLWLPDGRHFLYLVWSAQAEARGIYAGSLDSNEAPRRLMGADWGVTYARGNGAGGYLLFLRRRTLLAQSFDAEALRTVGEPFPVAEQVWNDETTPGLASFSVSETGVLAYRSGGIRTTQMIWHDRNGKALEPIDSPGAYKDPSLSPDEKRIAVSLIDPQAGTRDIWLFDLERSTRSRFTFHPSNDEVPLWSPDGSRIVFASDRDGAPNLYQKATTASGTEEILLQSSVSKYPTGWSRDGRYIVYANWDPKTSWDLWILPMTGDRTPRPYLQTEFDAFQAQFSPDGRWIAYVSNDSNPQYEVYVQPFPISTRRWQISTQGGAQPSWRRDGRELYYLAPDRKLMAVELKTGATFEAGKPRPLFQTQISDLIDNRNHYAPGADGQRFLVDTVVGESPSSPITIVLNWSADLKN